MAKQQQPRLSHTDVEVATRLGKERLAFGMTQKQLSAEIERLCGARVHQQLITQYESGKMPLPLGRFVQICVALRIDPLEVLETTLAKHGDQAAHITDERPPRLPRVDTYIAEYSA